MAPGALPVRDRRCRGDSVSLAQPARPVTAQLHGDIAARAPRRRLVRQSPASARGHQDTRVGVSGSPVLRRWTIAFTLVHAAPGANARARGSSFRRRTPPMGSNNRRFRRSRCCWQVRCLLTVKPNPSASRRTVAGCGDRRRPRSRSEIPRRLSLAFSASSSCERPAAARYCWSSSANCPGPAVVVIGHYRQHITAGTACRGQMRAECVYAAPGSAVPMG